MKKIISVKRCSRCKETKSVSEYYVAPSRRGDGYTSICRDCNRELRKENYNSIKEKEYRTNNKEKIKVRIDRWRNNHPEKKKEYRRKRRASEKGSNGTITAEEWNSLVEKYGNRCLCCGKRNAKLTLDHVIPLKLGGSHTIDNIQPLCLSCNSSKGAKYVDYR